MRQLPYNKAIPLNMNSANVSEFIKSIDNASFIGRYHK